jgi:hypothetical protein
MVDGGVPRIWVEASSGISASAVGGSSAAAFSMAGTGSGSMTCTSYSASSNKSPECSESRVPGP